MLYAWHQMQQFAQREIYLCLIRGAHWTDMAKYMLTLGWLVNSWDKNIFERNTE